MPAYSYPYNNEDFEPAMPVAEVILLSRSGETAAELVALVDSGSDATLLPIESLRAAGARYLRSGKMRGITGPVVPVDMYIITVQLGQHTIPGIKAIAGVNPSEAILGRDVLNQLDLRLIGPAQELWFE